MPRTKKKQKKPVLQDQSLSPDVEEAIGVILWGPPFAGKTVLAHTFPRTRTLDLDGKMSSVKWAIRTGHIKKDYDEVVYRTLLPGSGEKGLTSKPSVLDRATDTLDQWREELDDWDTLICDSATSASEACIAKALWALGKNRPSYSDTYSDAQSLGFRVMRRQDWGPAMSLFEGLMDQLREFLAYGKNVIVTAHEYEETTESGLVKGKYPLLIGQLRQRIPKDFAECWYIDKNEDGVPVLHTESDKYIHAGSSLGSFPTELENPTYAKIIEEVKKAQS